MKLVDRFKRRLGWGVFFTLDTIEYINEKLIKVLNSQFFEEDNFKLSQ